MNNKKCPNCGYELDSWNDCVSINNILECPECEDHFELKAFKLNQPQGEIPEIIVNELEDEIEEAYSSKEINVYSDAGDYLRVITAGLDKKGNLYKFMFPANDALRGCSNRNLIILYLIDSDLVHLT
ncbi:hypothetical protein [Lactococcus lactis]|uniref:hypothetical protein n=1 Tax=Lactococcus lactis TaxID=1358 RepID=UPI003D12FC0E